MSRRSQVYRLAALLLILSSGSCGGDRSYQGWPMDPPVPAPGIEIVRADAAPLSFARPDGRLTLVVFGYTSCPDVCPTTLSDWRRARAALRRDSSRVRFVFVSVDWKHDTPPVAAEFARRFDPAFIGVVADSTALRGVLRAFKAEARYVIPTGGDAETVSHTDYTYLVDRAGRIRLSYPFGTKPRVLAADLQRMLRAGD